MIPPMDTTSPAQTDTRTPESAPRLGPEALGAEDLRIFGEIEAWRKGDSDAQDQRMRATYHVDKELAFRDSYQPPHPTILILHASVGSGHRSAAIAIAQDLCDLRDRQLPAFPDGSPLDPATRVVVADILAWGDHVFDGNKTATSFTGSTRPLYDLTWRYTFTGRALWGQGTFLNYVMWRKFTRYIGHIKPLAVIATHIMGANMAAGARTICKQHYPLVCVPTDYETEGLWPHKAADVFCLGNESMAETLRARHIAENRIAITGIPTRIDFRRSYDTAQVRERFGLPADKKIVLALAGATLPQPYVIFRQTLESVIPAFAGHPDLHLVMVCGKDADYAAHVRQTCAEHGLDNVTVLDYVNGMAALMAASDVIVTKSGGLTVTECLVSRTPMILVGRAYGQEKVNVNMLTNAGAAIHVTTARELVSQIDLIDQHPERLSSMVVNANLLRRPNAAHDIARCTLALTKLPADDVRHTVVTKKLAWTLFNFYWGDKPAHIR